MNYTIAAYEEKIPIIGNNVYIADGARIIGDVELCDNSSVWFNSVLRGDVAAIKIGNNTNIQDGTVIHTSRNNGVTLIGKNITIGHMSLIHACQLMDYSFIGMGSIIMDKVVVEEYGFVAAGSLVTPNKIIKMKELWAGRPAKFLRYITEEELFFIKENALKYVQLSMIYLKKMDYLKKFELKK